MLQVLNNLISHFNFNVFFLIQCGLRIQNGKGVINIYVCILLDKPFSNLKEQRTKLIMGTQIVLAVHEMSSNKCVFGAILNKLDRIKLVLNIGDHCQYIL